MATNPEDLLKLEFGGKTVEENLQAQVDSGMLLKSEEGFYALPEQERGVSPWLQVGNIPHLDCLFNFFLFDHAYSGSAIPHGCKECFKVVVLPKTLRQLLALRSIQEKIECASKCGVEVDRVTTQDIYSGFFYCIGLGQAREIYRIVREAVNADPVLGSDVQVHIKRGCTRFEIKCGPSDKYQFRPELPELEAYLKTRFRRSRPADSNEIKKRLSTFNLWIETAYRIGDDTYLDFTAGKRLYPKTVTYDP